MAHTIHSRHVHYGWDNGLEPVLEVEPGEAVEFEVVDASGGQLNPGSTAADVARLDFERVNPVTGPVFIKGAKPGDVLEVEILEFGPARWGWTAIIPGFGLLADEFPDPYLKIWDLSGPGERAWFNERIAVPLAPFPGTIGVALPEPGRHSIVPPRKNGGNMDIRHLTAGTRLLLPVWVEGALFSIGDTHAAQGDGEVCGTAIEAAMQVACRFRIRRDLRLDEPAFIVPGPLASGQDPRGYFVTTGISDDLMEATRKAVRAMIRYLGETYHLEPAEAYALASVAVDLKISEVVDAPNWVVSAFLPQSLFVR
ncbi:acetamidase [Thermaerobacter sp. FW80]|uniref:acetamidase/formamidase family protein n=1 Tax=Thermaerobacter sp. FW80 TaxID=2546351 RepID=UPI0010754466|nr:acetamidase/formamidase family protein [Thermaerobacter sp. FW80]QBS38272.1 acetamidase [Thermaerobacter sp. FW80]